MRAMELRGTAASALAVALLVAALSYVGASGSVGPPPTAVAQQGSTRSPQAWGSKGETDNPVFQSLATSFAELKRKGYDLELLTESNEERHPFKFVAEATPTVLTGTQHTGSRRSSASKR